MNVLDTPIVGGLVKARIKPTEVYPFWNRYYGGFARPCRDLEAGDLSVRAKTRLNEALDRCISRQRPRLLVKITGWCRLGFLDALFSDARFIHVARDWRAVANSTMNVHFWRGWLGPANWRWGLLTPELAEEWAHHDRSFVALAGIQQKILLAALEHARTRLKNGALLEIKYEDLCERPMEVMSRVCDFCELDMDPALERAVKHTTLRNSNHKWREDLTELQGNILETVLREPLDRYGYL